MSNPYEHAARLKKAQTLAIALDVRGVAEAAARHYSTDQRREIALAAGVNRPSPETWVLVLDALKAIEATRARLGARAL